LRVLLASLARAGLPAPRWVPATHGGVAADDLARSFLAGEPVLVPLSPPLSGPDRLARLLAFAQQAGAEVDLVPIEVLWGPVERPPSLWNLRSEIRTTRPSGPAGCGSSDAATRA